MREIHLEPCQCGCDVFLRIENKGMAIVHPNVDGSDCPSNARYFATAFGGKCPQMKVIDGMVRAWNIYRSMVEPSVSKMALASIEFATGRDPLAQQLKGDSK